MLGQVRLERAPYRYRHRKGSRDMFSSMCLSNWLSFTCPPSGSISQSVQTTLFSLQGCSAWKVGGAVIFQVCPEARGRGLAASCGAKRHMGAMSLHHLADDSLDVLTCLGQLCADCTDGTPHAGWPWPRDLKGEKHANPSCAELCVPHRLLSNLPLPPREYVGHCWHCFPLSPVCSCFTTLFAISLYFCNWPK